MKRGEKLKQSNHNRIKFNNLFDPKFEIKEKPIEEETEEMKIIRKKKQIKNTKYKNKIDIHYIHCMAG